ncbi:hypothetical protein HII31_02038 [Pseudocercospora fuligena]|uniref:Uncharacterized protein n=1 Tax=Pseudocercospora fuligena TaxID=685502 RepID=A0A8H6RSS5_9PEZI|nr:hypothetical protein HII31_02038 [Pseudocercospora fuligena]
MIAIKRFIFLTAVAIIVLLGPFFFGYHFTTIKDASLSYINSASRSNNFHLLLPATGPNLNFCRLILSAAITGYPEPIFIGWDGRGMYNGSESHLFKITETLTYLRSLPPSSDNELVLVLDAYDVWLQLRPEIMIERYYKVLKKNDDRLRIEGILGKRYDSSNPPMRNTLVFGPDKIHWPQGSEDAATWAVPESSMPRNAFGPDTDTDMYTARPRWLNSGTILGPVKDMRDMFSATVDMLSKKYNAEYEFRNSDQYYFAEVWAEQEVHRMRLREGEEIFSQPHELPDGGVGRIPEIPEGKRTEYGICLDYETEMFQTAAAYDHHLTWMRFNHSTLHPDLRRLGDDQRAAETASGLGRELRIDEWVLKSDVRRSSPPFSALRDPQPEQAQSSWADVLLGTNVVTQDAFPLFHVTGDKSLRDRWWPRMWFHPYSEQLLKDTKALQLAQEDPRQFSVVDGVRWRGAIPVMKKNHDEFGLPEDSKDSKGGGWRDSGEYVHWGDMCGAFEDKKLYVEPVDAGREVPEGQEL